MKREEKRIRGSITVFMALCMLIIIAIMCTQIQAVAVHTGQFVSDKAHEAAQEAVMSHYSSEIYDNYHIFVMDAGYGNASVDKDRLKSDLTEYMQASCNSEKPFKEKSYSMLNLTGINFDSISKVDTEKITDEDGKLFVDQVVQYMKYKVGADFVKKYIKKFSAFDNTDNVTQVVEKQQEIFETASQLSDDVMLLMGYIDGIEVKGGQIKYDNNGHIGTVDGFVKKIVQKNTCMSDIGINNSDYYKIIDSKCTVILEAIDEIRIMFQKYRESVENNNKDNIKRRKRLCESMAEKFEVNIEESLNYSNLSIDLINKIVDKKEEYQKSREAFKEYIEQNKDDLPDGMYESLSKQEETVDEKLINKLPEMKAILEKNITILEKLKDVYELGFEADTDCIDSSIELLNNLDKEYSNYSVKNLNFDYKGLKTKDKKVDFFSVMKETLSNGIIGLVMGEKTKSIKKKMQESKLASEGNVNVISLEDGAAGVISGAGGKLEEAISSVKNVVSMMGNGFGGITELLSEKADNLIDTVLIDEYINQNFNMYSVDAVNVNDKIKHSLDYEKEYIICGNKTDMANIKSMVNRILAIRTSCNLVYLLIDQSKNAQAREVATTVFGFTGIPAIVEIAKIVIQVIWAYEESIVDANALMKGYKVPVMKSTQSFRMTIKDIPIFTKVLVEKKSEFYKKGTLAGAIPYDVYADLFLIMTSEKTKAYRCMDLIQANINLTYGSSLKMKNCLYGISSTAKVNIPLKYMSFKFSKKMIKESLEDRQYSSDAAYCY